MLRGEVGQNLTVDLDACLAEAAHEDRVAQAFLAGGANFAGSDAYLSDDEVEQAKQQCGPDGAMDLPVYISPISVAFNLPGIESLNLDAPTIAKIFKGEIKRWNAEQIKQQNPQAIYDEMAKMAAVLRKSWCRLRLSTRATARVPTWGVVVLTPASPG